MNYLSDDRRNILTIVPISEICRSSKSGQSFQNVYLRVINDRIVLPRTGFSRTWINATNVLLIFDPFIKSPGSYIMVNSHCKLLFSYFSGFTSDDFSMIRQMLKLPGVPPDWAILMMPINRGVAETMVNSQRQMWNCECTMGDKLTHPRVHQTKWK